MLATCLWRACASHSTVGPSGGGGGAYGEVASGAQGGSYEQVTESLARLFSNDWAPLSLTRNLFLKAMDIVPSAKSIFAQQAMGFGFKNSELAANDE